MGRATGLADGAALGSNGTHLEREGGAIERESELAGRLAADVDKAFPELVITHQDRIYSGVRSFIGETDAADVTQETFIRAHRALHRYESARVETLRITPWLWTIAINLCRNWARTRARRPQTVQLAFDQVAADDPAAVATDGAMLAAWKRRLALLSEAQRTAIVLRHVVGLSHQEIAAATGRPVGTTKADVNRGLAKLRTVIQEEETP